MYAPKAQQIEGLRFVLLPPHGSIKRFKAALMRLRAARFINTAQKTKLEKNARAALNMSYEEWRNA